MPRAAKYVALSKGLTLGPNKYVTVNPGNNGWDLREKNKYVPIFRFCDILICFGTLSMSFRMCRLALISMSALVPGLTGGINGKKNKYVAVFRFCDILIIFLGTLSMSFRMCGLALI